MNRLSVDITAAQHKQLKAMAAIEGKSIRQFVVERLFPASDKGGDAAWVELKALLQERIASGLAGNVSGKSISEILDEELHADSRA